MSATHLLTAEEFFELPDPPDRRVELVRGLIREKPLLVVIAGLVKANVLTSLSEFLKLHELGLVLPGLGCVLGRDPDTVRVVETCFLARDCMPEGEPSEWFWEGPPTLDVEIVSPDDLANDFYERVQDYLAAGTQQVWVLWPRNRSMTVYDAVSGVRELGPDSTLDGGSLLPGFSVRVGELFEVPRRPGC